MLNGGMGARGLLITQETLFGENRRGKDFMRSKNKSGVFSRCALLLIGVVVFGAGVGYSHPKKEPKGRCFGVRISKGNFGFIDESGEVIRSGFDAVTMFRNGRAWCRKGNQYSLIDTQCNVVSNYPVSKIDSSAELFSEGVSWLKINKNTNYLVSVSGTIISTNQAERIREYKEGFAPFYKEGKWGAYDALGNVVIKNTFPLMYSFSQGLAVVKSPKTGQYGYINYNGKYIIPPIYDQAFSFHDGVAVVEKKNEFLCLDTCGNIIYKTSTLRLNPFMGGVASAQIKGEKKWGLIDLSGKWLVKPTYYIASVCAKNMVLVYRDENSDVEFVNNDGQTLFKIKGKASIKVLPSGFVFLKRMDGSEEILNRKGALVWKGI